MTDALGRLEEGERLLRHGCSPEFGSDFHTWAVDNFPWMRDVIRAAEAWAEADHLLMTSGPHHSEGDRAEAFMDAEAALRDALAGPAQKKPSAQTGGTE